ncbi:hypothetical protein A3K93_08555 [Acinetobacter sp. NCu2D-2]|uniref:hypothetical protein n=1 Tax=Acinetobacter sp. NCu2D-2 TaxID=1608473 RepID=UPI0007CDE796|nr:hypothetical protein [Acinetobacter sp. NCu2D-2]ANF82241.1 hypothetical protein A3K93_08555 [Acinetobacter sp. NCu2D-2]
MSAEPEFNLQQLQRQYPEAFFCRLGYSRYKLPVFYKSFAFITPLISFILITYLCSVLIALPLHQFYFASISDALDVSTIILMGMGYPYLIYIHYQAKYSSYHFAQRIQHALYALTILCLVLLINFLFIHIELISLMGLITFASLSLGTVFIEVNFKPHCRALDHIKLQKIRQLAYWTFRQSQRHKNRQQEYLDVHHLCLKQEHKLLLEIKYINLKDSFAEH